MSATPSPRRIVATPSHIEAQRRSSEALGGASPRRAQTKRSHWERPSIHRSLGARMTRNVGHASARPQAIRSAPPITTRQTYPDGAERARAMPEPGDPGGYPANGAAPGDALALRDDPTTSASMSHARPPEVGRRSYRARSAPPQGR